MTRVRTLSTVVLAASLPLVLTACEFGYKVSEQTGYRGSGTAQVTNVALRLPEDNIPPPPYPLDPNDSSPPASQTYQNVQVLGDVSTDEFNRVMLSMNDWIGTGEQGCNYCHNPENMASEEKYTYKVARRMLQMTRQINSTWSNHVQQTGVTCYTCHRGNAVPEAVWSIGAAPNQRMALMGNKRGQNTPDPNVGYASLPFDPFAGYLQGRTDQIRVASSSPFPSRDWNPSIKDAEGSYGLMMHVSSALGVNCTYCHNSQSFRSWGNSTQKRETAFYGVRMVRDINENYITSLQSVFPANRLGPQGDPYKVNCATCHAGKPKPLGGISMLRDHPALGLRPDGTTPTTPGAVRITPGVAAPGAPAALMGIMPGGVTPLVADPRATTASCTADFGRLLTNDVQFDTNSARLSRGGLSLLDQLAVAAGRCSAYRLTVEGHTDAVGTQATNLPLSRDRAAAVANYLIGKGVAPGQLSAVGYGASRPKAGTSGQGANQANRRIAITVTG